MDGLFLVRSTVSSRIVVAGSALFSPYDNVRHRKLSIRRNAANTWVSSHDKPLLECSVLLHGEADGAIDTSVFSDWGDANQFTSARSFNFIHDTKTASMQVVQGVLKRWVPTPVLVSAFDESELGEHQSAHCGRALALQVSDVAYLLRLGRLDEDVNPQ